MSTENCPGFQLPLCVGVISVGSNPYEHIDNQYDLRYLMYKIIL
jgi:hypothetical protein